ncbi:MAG: enoyl-CoA hydratase/isomerase family protein [Dehalococcoidia bacterium]|nr:MAG: enoyl-CoA hydratase/isomerase family protein [Dehalococcoidia bacterium]
MSAFDTIVYEKRDGIAYITLNRPQALNAVNIKMRDELYEALPAIDDDPDVMVAILKGAGDKGFSAGADITEFGIVPSQAIGRQVRWERDLWGRFLSLSKPLIAAIHGFALGAGVEMSMCCDVRVASEDARFGLPEVGIGMIPTAGGSQTMPRLAPLGKAIAPILTGEIIDAAEALRIGLVHRVVARAELIPSAESIAIRITSFGQIAVRCAKQAIIRGLDLTLEQGLEMESRLFTAVLDTEDARAGIRAYLDSKNS